MKRIIIAAFLACVVLCGCTENQRSRNFGGTQTIDLPKGTKLVTGSWKEHDLWYLTRPMRADETPETSEMIESSSFGVMQGKVIFKESR